MLAMLAGCLAGWLAGWLAGCLAAWLAGWLGAPLRRGVFLRVAALVVGAGVRRLAGRAAAKGIAPPLTYVGMRFPRRLGLPPRPKVRGRGLAKVRQETALCPVGVVNA